MPDYDKINQQDVDARRRLEEDRLFKKRYTERQQNTERHLDEMHARLKASRGSGSDGAGAAGLLVLAVALAIIYAVLAAAQTIAMVGGGIIVGSLVLGLLGLPVLKPVEAGTPAGGGSSFWRAYLTLVLTFAAFGLAMALGQGVLFVLMHLGGNAVPAFVPALAPIAAVVDAAWYFVTNSVAPDGLVTALTPGGVAITIVVLAVIGGIGGTLMLRHRDRLRFAGPGGVLRAVVVLAVPLVPGLGGIGGLVYFLAQAGY